MAKQTLVRGMTELRAYLDTLNTVKSHVYILFTGDKLQPSQGGEESGESAEAAAAAKATKKAESWCSDCNEAEPVISANLSMLKESSEFITCFVGDRPTWKNPENEFRKDAEFKLKSIPTLMLWKKNKVLVEDQCADESLVQMLFENDS